MRLFKIGMIAFLGAYSWVSFGQINNTEGNSQELSEALDKNKKRGKRKKLRYLFLSKNLFDRVILE